jgi:uncharacterized protein YcnI
VKILQTLLITILAALVAVPAAAAHVTINPGEWEAGGFARFVIRVPTERDVPTTEVTIQFPESVTSARFMPAPGWERTIEMEQLDEPIQQGDGEEPITERIASVTWSGGTITPDEFMEFGVSFRVPETPGEQLVFPAIQTYQGGEVVEWIGAEDSDTPAPLVTITEPAAEEGEEPAAEEPAAEETESPDGEAVSAADADDDDSGRVNLALGLAIAGLLAGLGALGLVLSRRRSA